MVELKARNVTEAEIKVLKGIKKMKDKLKTLEIDRVKTATMESTDEEKKQAVATANKVFIPQQSEALFV